MFKVTLFKITNVILRQQKQADHIDKQYFCKKAIKRWQIMNC